MARSLARQAVMQLLYERMTGGNDDNDTLEMICEAFADDEVTAAALAQAEDSTKPLTDDDQTYLQTMLEGVALRQSEIDKVISSHLTGSWSLDRLAFVDLCILRLAVYEIRYMDGIPDNVAVSEAVELSKRFCADKSSSYVNGVLGAIVREKAQQK